MITKMGVNEFKKPASELSIFNSANGKRMAGIKFPTSPENNTKPILLEGILFKCLTASGNKTKPAHNNRSAATCEGDNLCDASLMRMNELPQIKDSATNI